MTARVDVENGSAPRLAVGAGAVWALAGRAVERIDPASARVEYSIPITGSSGPTPNPVAVGRAAVWVANWLIPATQGLRHTIPGSGTVSRIDPRTNAVAATIPVGRYSTAIAVGAGAVWVVNRDDGTLSRIDPRTNQVVATIHVGGRPEGIAVGDGAVWVTVS